MNEYIREYPLFSLCGLNCGLCPRFHTNGSSRCPGCGGKEFHLKHPTCAVITCNKKHDNVEFCFQCSSYPCDRYKKKNNKDSFITYKNINKDMKSASDIFKEFKTILKEKVEILELLLKKYNDGRKKNFYCLAVNLLPLSKLKEIVSKIKNELDINDMDLKDQVKIVADEITKKANECKVDLILRK